jgi:hypothetical protein
MEPECDLFPSTPVDQQVPLGDRAWDRKTSEVLSDIAVTPSDASDTAPTYDVKPSYRIRDDPSDPDDSKAVPKRRDVVRMEIVEESIIGECTKCGHLFRVPPEPISVSSLFPLPNRMEVLLSIIGSTDYKVGTPRPRAELMTLLKLLERLLAIALKNSDDEISLSLNDAAPDDDDGSQSPASQAAQNKFVGAIRDACLRVPGWLDFVIAAGFERHGVQLTFYRPPSQRPCQRLLIALQLLSNEITLLESSSEKTLGLHTTPIFDRIGPHLTLYSEYMERLEDRLYYPTFEDDLLTWIKLRNYFHCAIVLAADSDQSETWIQYFHSCQDACQDVLDRVRSKNESLRIPDFSLRELLYDFQMVKFLGGNRSSLFGDGSSRTPAGKRGSGITPPSNFATPASNGSPMTVSPGELLLRTPLPSVDRENYNSSAPPPQMWIREDTTLPMGLLNIRQSCYANSIVQLLFSIPEFVQLVLYADQDGAAPTAHPNPGAEEKILHRLQVLFSYLSVSSCACASSVPLLESVAKAFPSFGDRGQHDPHEFASCVLSAVGKALETRTKANCVDPPPTAADLPAISDKENVPEVETKSAASSLVTHRGESDVPSAKELFQKIWESKTGEIALELPFVNSEGASGTNLKKQRLRTCSAEEFVITDQKTAIPTIGLIPLYFDPASLSKEPQDVDPAPSSKSASVHVDPLAELLKPTGESGNSKPTSLFETALDDYMIEVRDGIGGVLRFFESDPGCVVFYLPSRISASSSLCHQVPFNFPASIDLSRYIKTESTNTTEGFKAQLVAKLRRDDLVRQLAEAKKGLAKAEEAHALLATVPDMAQASSNFLESIRTTVEKLSDDLRQTEHQIMANQRPSDSGTQETEGAKKKAHHQLMAIVLHHGSNSNYGHYTSFVRRPAADGSPYSEGNWYRCDDVSVEPVSAETVYSESSAKDVYCLLYKREGLLEGLEIPQSPSSSSCSSSGAGFINPVDQVPIHLRTLIEKEDLRKQLRVAQRLSYND